MTLNRKSRVRRPGFRPALDGLEDRVVLSFTTPTTAAAVPAQIAAINSQAVSISNYVVSQVDYALAVQGHVSTTAFNNYAATYATAKADFAQLQTDITFAQTYVNTTLNTLSTEQSAMNATIAQNYTTQITFIDTYYAGLTPAEQAAQASLIQTNIQSVTKATQSAYNTVHTYFTGQENFIINQYNAQVPAANRALANAANAVRLSGNLYTYVVSPTTATPLLLPIYTPVTLLKPVS